MKAHQSRGVGLVETRRWLHSANATLATHAPSSAKEDKNHTETFTSMASVRTIEKGRSECGKCHLINEV